MSTTGTKIGWIVVTALILTKCASMTGLGNSKTTEELANEYFECVYNNYVTVNPTNTFVVEEALEQSMKSCSKLAFTYGMALAEDVGVSSNHQYFNTTEYFQPGLEQQTMEAFTRYISNHVRAY